MIYTIIILFALAAVIGLTILMKVLKGATTSKPAVYAHGALAAIGLVLLIVYYMSNPGGLMVPLILFVVAALGGFLLFAKDIGGKTVPKPLALIHAGAAVVAFLLLLMTVL
ncbi:MAG: hypothetical protein ABJF04_17405 [Reichenbachiella sp.]|uniref:hypothetical protein n=1 Tax=Reichenbachiella sp. TaxID=2184521 RepID=UPI0032638EB2